MGFESRDYNQGTSDHDMFRRMGSWSANAWLIGLCIGCFFVDGFTARLMGREFFMGGLLRDWGAFTASDAIFGFQIWRLVSFQFLHAGLFHILFNLVILFFLGRMLESYLGSKRYLAFYLLSGVGGGLFYLLLWAGGAITGNPNVPFLLQTGPDTPLVGASAGIYGVLVAVAVIAPAQRIQLLFPPITLTIRALALILIGIAVFMVMVGGPNDGGQAAHLGGAAIGYLLIKRSGLLNWADRFSPSAIQAGYTKGRYERRLKKEQAGREEIDRILAKVSEQGLQSLSKREQKILQQDTDRLRGD
ncbi:MAG: rhomboid family intramembrane serine protease [Phycisphaeraceae bacterium]